MSVLDDIMVSHLFDLSLSDALRTISVLEQAGTLSAKLFQYFPQYVTEHDVLKYSLINDLRKR